MRRLRTRKSFVLFGLAIVVFVAFVPALSSSLPSAILTPLWLVVPAVSIVIIRRTAARCDDQPVALLSLLYPVMYLALSAFVTLGRFPPGRVHTVSTRK
jgi:hypothetical protein